MSATALPFYLPVMEAEEAEERLAYWDASGSSRYCRSSGSYCGRVRPKPLAPRRRSCVTQRARSATCRATPPMSPAGPRLQPPRRARPQRGPLRPRPLPRRLVGAAATTTTSTELVQAIRYADSEAELDGVRVGPPAAVARIFEEGVDSVEANDDVGFLRGSGTTPSRTSASTTGAGFSDPTFALRESKHEQTPVQTPVHRGGPRPAARLRQ